MKTKQKPKCVKSAPCGYSCIDSSLTCHETLSPSAAKLATALVEQITAGSRAKGAGSSSLNEQEVSALLASRDFLQTATPAEVVARATKRGLTELAEDGGGPWSDEDLAKVTDAIWGALPAKAKSILKNKGSLASGNYMNPETGEHGPANEPRAKFLLRRFVEQNGRDAYTGLPLDILKADVEHIEPFGAIGKAAERPDNLVFTSPSVNQRKAEKSMGDFFKEQVQPVADAAKADPDYWGKQEAKAAESNSKKNAVDDLLKSKAKDSWTDDDVDQLGSKYYYAGRALGHLLAYEKTRPRGVSGQTFNMKMGPPLAKAFAAAYRAGDQDRIKALEQARVSIVEAARAESKERKGNAGAAGGLMEQEYAKQQKLLGW
jgi:hypothetical protein